MAKGYGKMPGGRKGQGNNMMGQIQAMQQQMELIQAQLAEENRDCLSGRRRGQGHHDWHAALPRS